MSKLRYFLFFRFEGEIKIRPTHLTFGKRELEQRETRAEGQARWGPRGACSDLLLNQKQQFAPGNLPVCTLRMCLLVSIYSL